jgi:hypothetical protein
MPRVSGSDGSGLVAAVEAAAQRLAMRLSEREASSADLATCAESVPLWWRRGLAGAAVFGDGLMSLPGADALGFSRPVTLLSASEISAVAGGEYVPLAWLDGGSSVALVHDRAARPVFAVAMDQAQGAAQAATPPERLAPSLVAFLDALMPQTVCRLTGEGTQATVELAGELSLLVEINGEVEQRTFDSPGAVGEYVAEFLDQAIESGMRLRYCSARLNPLIHARASWMAARLEVMPEVRARAAIQHLIADQRLVLEEDSDPETIEDLIDEAARFLERHGHGQHAAERFADWLSQHPAVNDLYADDDTVRAALSASVVGTARLTEAMHRADRRGRS